VADALRRWGIPMTSFGLSTDDLVIRDWTWRHLDEDVSDWEGMYVPSQGWRRIIVESIAGELHVTRQWRLGGSCLCPLLPCRLVAQWSEPLADAVESADTSGA
jgi:hypothetical protein